MGFASLATCTRRTAPSALALLVAGWVVAALLVARAAPAAAEPSTASTSASPTATQSSTAPSAAARPRATPSREPAATAPSPPIDHGPPCTAHAGAPNPVICLPAGSGEDHAASATPGQDVEFAAQVVNGPTSVSDADVVITLPPGLGLESDEDDPVYRVDGWYDDDGGDFTDLTCHTGPPSTITCSVGTLMPDDNILVVVDLEVSQRATPNTTLTFQVALQSAATPPAYESTSVSARIRVLEPSDLVVSLSPAVLRTIVGHRATMIGTVHNAGPGDAPATVAVVIDLNEKHPSRTHFAITNGTSVTDLPGDGGSTVAILGGRSGTPLRARLLRQALARAAVVQHHAQPSLRYWPLGTIAPGATTRVAIKLKALSVGTDSLTFGAISATQDPSCEDSVSAGCSFVVLTHITALAAPAAPAPLANSGPHELDVQVGVALWALVFGSLCVWAGRRRITPRHG